MPCFLVFDSWDLNFTFEAELMVSPFHVVWKMEWEIVVIGRDSPWCLVHRDL